MGDEMRTWIEYVYVFSNLSDSIMNIGPPESPWHVLPGVIEQISYLDIFLGESS